MRALCSFVLLINYYKGMMVFFLSVVSCLQMFVMCSLWSFYLSNIQAFLLQEHLQLCSLLILSLYTVQLSLQFLGVTQSLILQGADNDGC